ncbi:MAG: hypothetical protein PHT02_11595 [Tissierellia bacterium]|nr:hypothetical protein [Tissierellia bacterium]
MARRRVKYSRKRRINILPVIIIVFAVAAVVVLMMKLFSSRDYVSQLNYVLSSDVKLISGNVSKVSEVDTEVYVNDGITYTNQHKGKIHVNDLNEAGKIRIFLDSLKNLSEDSVVSELPSKQSGYYWLHVNVIVEDNFLLFKNEEEYAFNFYYDIEDEKVYVKEKFYDEFSKKNNKVKLQGYNADENYKKLIEELTTY